MSNHKAGENPARRKSEVSWATIIVPGLVGPKPRRVSVGDGQRVNIPVLVLYCLGVRGMLARAGSWLYPSNPEKVGEMKDPFGLILVRVLTRKALKRVYKSIRTANRHRCSGREDQGVRVILR